MQNVISGRIALNRPHSSICRSCLRGVLQQQQQHQRRKYISAALRHASPDYKLSDADRIGPVRSIGIVGGGVSGLATAYYISEQFKSSFFKVPKVTIYESSEQLGGWLQTKRIDVPDGEGYIRVEQGPRTLAASSAGMLTMDLLHDLGIADSIRWVKKNDPGAQNRYIYDGGDELQKVPTDMPSFIKDIMEQNSIMLPAIKHILFNFYKRMDALPPTSDASLGQAMSQIVGEQTVQRLLSSFIHGIYAGNVWNLSPRAKGPWSHVLAHLVDNPKSLLQIMRSTNQNKEALWAGEEPKWLPEFQDSFVFYLKEGLGLLSLAMESHLRMNTQTDIKLNAKIDKISPTDDGISVEYKQEDTGVTDEHDYVVSAIPPHVAQNLLSPSPPWTDLQAVSVGTVTFFWPESHPIPYDGFGYVISNATPMDQNPHGALGVIFDSSTRPAQDTVSGQKVTVLLGGEFWEPGLKKGMKLPSKEELIQQAEETLETQLGVTEKAAVISANIVSQCIPQPSIDFMKSVHTGSNPAVETWAQEWNGRLLLTGPPVSGPGVHDCINGAWQTSSCLTQQEFIAAWSASHDARESSHPNLVSAWRKSRADSGFGAHAKSLEQLPRQAFESGDIDRARDEPGFDALWSTSFSRHNILTSLHAFSDGSFDSARRIDTGSGRGSGWTGTPGSKD